jgi:hypothetical protein
VVARHRDAHQLPDDDLAFAHDRLRLHRADGEDGPLRRVDDGGELVYAEHPEVADREGRARVLFRLQPPRARAFGEFPHLAADLPDALRVRRANDGRYQTVLDRDGDADVGALVIPNRLLLKRGVDRRVLDERGGDDFDDEVVDADLHLRVELVQLPP